MATTGQGNFVPHSPTTDVCAARGKAASEKSRETATLHKRITDPSCLRSDAGEEIPTPTFGNALRRRSGFFPAFTTAMARRGGGDDAGSGGLEDAVSWG